MAWKEMTHARSERWDRENAAPRLNQVAADLVSLSLSLVERRGGHEINGTRRTQRIVVERASTRFEIPCGEARCRDGGHDLTQAAEAGLRSHRHTFGGSSECRGYVGDRPCDRELEFAYTAVYSSGAQP